MLVLTAEPSTNQDNADESDDLMSICINSVYYSVNIHNLKFDSINLHAALTLIEPFKILYNQERLLA